MCSYKCSTKPNDRTQSGKIELCKQTAATVLVLHYVIIIVVHSIQKIAVTGTLANPPKFELRFKTLGSLLYLFDLQERVMNQIQLMTSASAGANETQLDDRYLSLLTAHALLKNIIQNSCNYVS
jgi:hypothetical protein